MAYIFRKKSVLIGISAIVVIAATVWIYSKIPTTYVTYDADSRDIGYINITDSSVWTLAINPTCRKSIEKVDPSPGFGAAHATCHKRIARVMTVDSVRLENDQRVYVLRPAESGEKGASYRVVVTTSDEQAVWDGKVTYERSFFPISIIRFIVAK